MTAETLADGRVISYTYDGNGNLASVTPPGRPPYEFAYTPTDLESTYAPPAVPGAGVTAYTYNADRQLTAINSPGGQTVTLDYDRR
jgi:YD repeat-containing protein